jgi:NTP pyrophosphatase (non-canonical NTP hydrolase)
MSKLLQYAEQCYSTSASKGFWDQRETRSKGEMVMLMVSELGECLEAHRESRLFDYRKVKTADGLNTVSYSLEEITLWKTLYTQAVKGTIEEELADVVIRILDYVHGWNITVIPREYRKESTGNFGHDLLRINWYMLQAFHDDQEAHGVKLNPMSGNKDWGYVLAAIEAFATWYNIDLETHIQWKMRYNSTREKLHGKAY